MRKNSKRNESFSQIKTALGLLKRPKRVIHITKVPDIAINQQGQRHNAIQQERRRGIATWRLQSAPSLAHNKVLTLSERKAVGIFERHACILALTDY